MKKLRTHFGLALSLVLLVATILPILILYLLSASGLARAWILAIVRFAHRYFLERFDEL
jgi:hypothetical protein